MYAGNFRRFCGTDNPAVKLRTGKGGCVIFYVFDILFYKIVIAVYAAFRFCSQI